MKPGNIPKPIWPPVFSRPRSIAWWTARRAMAAAGDVTALVVAGGVAANKSVRAALEGLAAGAGLRFVAPPMKLCTDNAAMIAWAGVERFARGEQDALDFAARPRWPLDPDAAPARGAGVKA
jgi:N6-L-threonylcarbamoyladenine synthase